MVTVVRLLRLALLCRTTALLLLLSQPLPNDDVRAALLELLLTFIGERQHTTNFATFEQVRWSEDDTCSAATCCSAANVTPYGCCASLLRSCI